MTTASNPAYFNVGPKNPELIPKPIKVVNGDFEMTAYLPLAGIAVPENGPVARITGVSG